MAGRKIDNGQTGLEVREIINSTIDDVEKVSNEISQVSEDVKSTIPLSNSEIEQIFKK